MEFQRRCTNTGDVHFLSRDIRDLAHARRMVYDKINYTRPWTFLTGRLKSSIAPNGALYPGLIVFSAIFDLETIFSFSCRSGT